MDESQAEARIRVYEGYEEYMYHDTKGIATIGIGFNLERGGAKAAIEGVGADYDEIMKGKPSDPSSVSEDELAERRLTADQISKLFVTDLGHAEDDAKSVLGDTFSQLNDPRQFVVVDMIFNMGKGGFEHFHHAIAAIKAQDYAEAAKQMEDSGWFRQVHGRAEKDCQMMKSGEWA